MKRRIYPIRPDYLTLTGATADVSGEWVGVKRPDQLRAILKLETISVIEDSTPPAVVVEGIDGEYPSAPARAVFVAGFGALVAGETISGGTSSATATISKFDHSVSKDFNKGVELASVSGPFTVGETVTGGSSSETAVIERYLPAAAAVEITRETISESEVAAGNRFVVPVNIEGHAYVRVSIDTGTGNTLTGNLSLEAYGEAER
jgi:hypothetical protein